MAEVPGPAEFADLLTEGYRNSDMSVVGPLFADDCRWGDDSNPNVCRSRDDVLRTFSRALASGVTADVLDVETGPCGVACRIEVNWPDPADQDRGIRFFHVFMVSGGQIREIRRYDDRGSARAAIAGDG